MPSSNINNVWSSQRLDVELECPSGQLCLVKKPDPQQLVTMGIIDKVDVLSKLVDTKHVKRVKGKPSSSPVPVDTKAISENPKLAMEILVLADKVVEAVVLEPIVKRPVVRDESGHPKVVKKMVEGELIEVEIPLPWADREDGQVYTDMIDFMDRMYIFQHAVGGNVDLASFRKQLELAVPDVADGN